MPAPAPLPASTTDAPETTIERLVRLATAQPGRRPVVLIDGRSGSGKTTLGAAVAAALDAQLVGLDDVYPGWYGLAAASLAVSTCILRPVDPGYRRWDWDRDVPSTWHELDPARPLVVEGAGCLTAASAPLATLRVWLELDAPTRRTRALARDGAAYEPWWEIWAAQETRHLALHAPQTLADVVL